MTLSGRGGCVVRKYDSVLLAWFILAAAALFSFSKKNPFHGRETTTIMNATSKELLFSIDKNVKSEARKMGYTQKLVSYPRENW